MMLWGTTLCVLLGTKVSEEYAGTIFSVEEPTFSMFFWNMTLRSIVEDY
jgi:hypothetical protein